jgi:hypothetical protein
VIPLSASNNKKRVLRDGSEARAADVGRTSLTSDPFLRGEAMCGRQFGSLGGEIPFPTRLKTGKSSHHEKFRCCSVALSGRLVDSISLQDGEILELIFKVSSGFLQRSGGLSYASCTSV